MSKPQDVEQRWILIDGVDGQPVRFPALVGSSPTHPAHLRYVATSRLPVGEELAWIEGVGPDLDGALQDLVKNAKQRVEGERRRIRSNLN
jgi:hypothetical protein